jgi:hypothetical protein
MKRINSPKHEGGKMYTNVSKVAIFAVLIVFISGFIFFNSAQEKGGGAILFNFYEEPTKLISGKSSLESYLSGEVLYSMTRTKEGINFTLQSLGFVTTGIKTEKGFTGNISVSLIPQKTKTTYDPKKRTINSEFMVEVHYPLIDKIKGFKEQPKGEKEIDNFRPFTEEFKGRLTFELKQLPTTDTTEILRKGSKALIELKLAQEVVGAIQSIELRDIYINVRIIGVLYRQKKIKIQPVFIRFTPATGCTIGTTTTATTGGSFTILRDRAIEMWSKCCVLLDFLPVVYVNNDDYRILSSSEETSLRNEYDDANAIEVFFVEDFDPVGNHGGGATWGSGTANAQIITCDTNLPVNLYNLAHELGHAFGLTHPGTFGNSTAGSLMEPSGFCEDNPAIMTDENCSNISNPLFTNTFRICWNRTYKFLPKLNK